MANELARDDGIPITLTFTITNVAGGPAISYVDGVLTGANGMNGMVVPTGYQFHPLYIGVEINDARTAGSATFYATKDGAELVNGPTVTIDGDNTLVNNGVGRASADPVDAGEEVSVSAVGDVDWAPDTADADVILIGILLPA